MIAGSHRPIAVVIDDDARAADALELMLRDWGAEVVAALSAEAALERLGARADAAAWVITDFDLGGTNGVDGAKLLLTAAPGARVLVLSGDRGASKAAAAAGFETLEKPAQAGAITAWLERA